MDRDTVLTEQKTQYCQVVILPRSTSTFSAIPIKIPAGIFVEIDKLIPEFLWKYEELRRAKTT